jgi:hypothetical protein
MYDKMFANWTNRMQARMVFEIRAIENPCARTEELANKLEGRLLARCPGMTLEELAKMPVPDCVTPRAKIPVAVAADSRQYEPGEAEWWTE